MTNRVVVSRVWTPDGIRRNQVIEFDEHGVISNIRAATSKDPLPESGLLIPGLVNAHVHLELSWLAGRVAPSRGFAEWAHALAVARGRAPSRERQDEHAIAAATQMSAAGTAAVCDVSNAGGAAVWMRTAGLLGIAQHELLGMDRRTLPRRLEMAARPDRVIATAYGEVIERPSPHALCSTPIELVHAAARRGASGAPATMHIAEDRAELELLAEGTGPLATMMDDMGIPWRWWRPPGLTPVELLHQQGLLGPRLILVHGVCLDAQAHHRLAVTGTPLCLCPRSNQHVSGRLPDVGGLLSSGVRLCLGTDSLASNTDLDVLGEIPILANHWPSVNPDVWLTMATLGGAKALGTTGLGIIAPGAAPGLVLLEDVEHPADLVQEVPRRRRWIVRPGRQRICTGNSS